MNSCVTNIRKDKEKDFISSVVVLIVFHILIWSWTVNTNFLKWRNNEFFFVAWKIARITTFFVSFVLLFFRRKCTYYLGSEWKWNESVGGNCVLLRGRVLFILKGWSAPTTCKPSVCFGIIDIHYSNKEATEINLIWY